MSEEKDEAKRKVAAEHWLGNSSVEIGRVSFDEGFNAGWDARDAKTCEWKPAGFNYETDCGSFYGGHDGDFCESCGGRIVEAKQ